MIIKQILRAISVSTKNCNGWRLNLWVLIPVLFITGCGGSAAKSNINIFSSASSKASSLNFTGSSSSSFAADSSVSSQAAIAGCDLPSTFSWVSTQPLITPQTDNFVSVKDPTIVYYNNLYHVFATAYDTKREAWGSVYLNFSDFPQASSAKQISMAAKPTGDTVAPQVFYFRPHKKWYLIYQWGAKYSTNTDIANPDTWTVPKPLMKEDPYGGLDYWVICDDAYCHLFFSKDDDKLYHAKVTLANFPNFSDYEIVMSDSAGKLFEASNVYKVEGTNKYLLLVEAYSPRYFRSWTATSLDGPWTPLADKQSAPFAGAANVTFEGEKWTEDFSHGEMIRSGYDETLTINPCNMQYLYQGIAPGQTAPYGHFPYRLALLKAK